MNERKRLIAQAAVQAALFLFAEDEESSSDSDDDIEMLVMKMYLKHKAKRRKLRNLRPNSYASVQQCNNSEQTTSETCNRIEQNGSPKPAQEEDASTTGRDSSVDTSGLGESDQPVGSKTTASLVPSVSQPFQLHVSHIPSYLPGSLASKILTDEDFKNHLKLSRTSVEELVRAVKNNRNSGRIGRPMMPAEKSVLLFLWFLGTSESYTSVAERFNVSKSVAYASFNNTCQSISALKEHVIQWPTGNAAVEIIQGFETNTTAHFPNVIGCLGATHIPISEPKDPSFVNRSDYNSVILQAVCDASGAFIDVFTGWPGSASHAHVWLYSPLYRELEAKADFLPNNSHLLGNEAYPLSESLIVPFLNNGTLTPSELHFNKTLESKRAVLHQAFALLKHRFERLNYLYVHIVENIKFITLAACVCHNIATREAERWPSDEHEQAGGDEGLNVPQVDVEEAFAVSVEAMEKRAQLAEQMFASIKSTSTE